MVGSTRSDAAYMGSTFDTEIARDVLKSDFEVAVILGSIQRK